MNTFTLLKSILKFLLGPILWFWGQNIFPAPPKCHFMLIRKTNKQTKTKNKTKQNKTKQNKTKQNKTKQSKTKTNNGLNSFCFCFCFCLFVCLFLQKKCISEGDNYTEHRSKTSTLINLINMIGHYTFGIPMLIHFHHILYLRSTKKERKKNLKRKCDGGCVLVYPMTTSSHHWIPCSVLIFAVNLLHLNECMMSFIFNCHKYWNNKTCFYT